MLDFIIGGKILICEIRVLILASRVKKQNQYRMDALKKLPEITILFWLMKICATTLGETAGDLMSMTMKIGYSTSSLILFGFFIVILTVLTFAARQSN